LAGEEFLLFDCSCAAAGGETEGADCACSPIQILVFPYSGGSNVGQIANQAAVELIKKSTGKLFCLAGIGAHIQSFIETTKGAKRIVAIDGCPTACARKTLEHASFTVTDPLVVTDLGVKKTHDFEFWQEDIAHVLDAVRSGLRRQPPDADGGWS
jgi:uncharacterized metal-binding protein